MLKISNNIIYLIFFFVFQVQTVPAQDKLMNILKDELKREMTGFQQNADSSDVPYLISYRVDETKSETVRTTLGSLVYSRASHSRIFTPMVRIGSFEIDNYHQLRETNTVNPGGVGYFTGLCGAESGSLQVSCVSPMLFARQIEIQKKAKSQSLPPLLPKS